MKKQQQHVKKANYKWNKNTVAYEFLGCSE